MRLTIIPEDGKVNIDGVAFDGIDLSWVDPSYHAIQWRGTEGEIEIYANGKPVENRPITSITQFQRAIDAWNQRKAESTGPF